MADLRRWGTSPALGFAVGAARCPDDLAVIDADDDQRPAMTYGEIEDRCETLASGLMDRGIGVGESVGILGRNSRAYAEMIVGTARTGADLVYLNTGWTAEQIAEVVVREQIRFIAHDTEFADLIPAGLSKIALDHPSGVALLDSLPGRSRVPAPSEPGRHIILTSGTTSSAPRGAARATVTMDAVAALLDAFPIHTGDTALIAAPLFHSWGWMQHRLTTVLNCETVLVRKPEPERLLALIEEHRVQVLVTVPVILRHLTDLPAHVRRRYDTSSLTCVAVSGADLPGTLAHEFMDAYGDVLYNLYGSTEAAFATVATPDDLRDDPNTAGKPLVGVTVEVLDRRGRKVKPGVDGRIFVGSRTSFAGYTDGSDKERIRGLVSTGDVGHLDAQGRLTVVGRSDDLIITGGENVHPAEVENVLIKHPQIADVAVTGADDPVYGQIVVAYVVPMAASRPESAKQQPTAATSGSPDSPPPKTVDETIDATEPLTPEAVIAWSRPRLGPAHRPNEVVLVDELPRNATGKLLRDELGELKR